MPLHINNNGSWVSSTDRYVNINGSWQKARRTWVNVNETWQLASGQVVDDFEDGNRNGWTVPGSTGGDAVRVDGLDGTDYRWEHSGFRQAHLAGADAVDRGPQPGDVFEFWFRIDGTTSGGVINRFEFSADGIREGYVYRVEWERETGDNELSIEKIVDGTSSKIATDAGFGPSIGFPYRCQIEWNSGDDQIAVQMFTPGGDAASNRISITDDSSVTGSEYRQPGVAIENSGNNTCSYDEIRIIN